MSQLCLPVCKAASSITKTVQITESCITYKVGVEEKCDYSPALGIHGFTVTTLLNYSLQYLISLLMASSSVHIASTEILLSHLYARLLKTISIILTLKGYHTVPSCSAAHSCFMWKKVKCKVHKKSSNNAHTERNIFSFNAKYTLLTSPKCEIMCENMYERRWERERKRETNSFGWAGFIVHHHYQQVINSACTLFYFNYRHKALYLYICMCVCVCVCGLRWSVNGVYLVMGLNRMERCG